MPAKRSGAVGVLRALLVGTLVVPVAIFAASSWLGYRSAFHDAEQELARTSEAAREHAARVFDAQALISARVVGMLNGMDDATIVASEPALHESMRQMIADLPQGLGVFVIGKSGRGLAASSFFPVPQGFDYSDRGYFIALRDSPKPIHVIPALAGRVNGGRIFFGIARRRTNAAGEFDGLVVVSSGPKLFLDFYGSLLREKGDVAALIREDGKFLVRSPTGEQAPAKIPDGTVFFEQTGANATHGTFFSTSVIDGVVRLYAYTRLDRYPIYAFVGRPVDAIVGAWHDAMVSHLLYGIPGTLVLFLVTLVALRRTESEQDALAQAREEIARREAAEADRQTALRTLEQTVAGLEQTVDARTRHLRKANDEIQRATDLLASILDSMADAVIVADGTGRIIHSNPAAQRLFGPSSIVGSEEWNRSYLKYFLGSSPPILPGQHIIDRAIGGEPTDNLETVMRPEGAQEDVHLIVNARPLRERSGEFAGAVVVYRDVTRLKETENQLRQSQKMEAIGLLTGGFAHDFNNILTVITGTIEVLAHGVADRPKLAAIAAMIDEAAQRGADLTSRLLAVARKQPLQPRETDINALILDAKRLLLPALGARIEIETSLEAGTLPSLVDPAQLTTAILNLAVNARDAMPDGGRLTIETRKADLNESSAERPGDLKPGQYVLIAVSDTGCGIPAAFIDKVFEPFFTTKEAGKGTGLGLSMAYGFVKQSAGHISIDSEEGRGTTVKIYLPRAVGPAAIIAESQTRWIEGGNESILVVEDDTLVRNFVTAQVASLGYRVWAVADATNALVAINSGVAFDLLFTDVAMPGPMNGRALAEEAVKRRPSLRVLFTTGSAEGAILHRRQLDAGVLLLAKPYRKSELARMIRLALSRQLAA